MKYETPELMALMPAINAIQITTVKSCLGPLPDGSQCNDLVGAYEDWE